MTQSWRIPIDFQMWMQQIEKRMIRQERRPSITNATQILGPGAGPYAVLLNDWNDEAATFNGIFYSEPGAANIPDTTSSPSVPDYDSANSTTWRWWMGQTFGTEDGYGIQRISRFHVDADADGSLPVGWVEYHRRFFLQNEVYSYTLWEAT